MSKIFMIGDTHAYIYPLSYKKWMDTLKDYFYNFYIPMLKEQVREGDICIHTGDLFDNRTSIPIDVLVDIQKIIEEISAILPIHILIGNHDLFTKSESEYNLPKVYRHMKNVYIYETTTQIEYNNLKLLMMPYIHEKSEQIKKLNLYKDSDYVFCHSDLNGAKMHMKSVAHKNTDKIDIEEFKSFKHVYSGHIHIVQRTKNFTFIGSIYQMDRGDYGDQKGVFILDTDTFKDKFIPNKRSPIFQKLVIKTEEDINLLESYDTSKDYIDLEISNTLLVGNRKLRRNLEAIIQKGSFTSIEYINDMVKTNSEGEVIVDQDVQTEMTEITSIDLNDFEKIVYQYTEAQSYESEKVKEGILKELDKIFEIYNNQYKFETESNN